MRLPVPVVPICLVDPRKSVPGLRPDLEVHSSLEVQIPIRLAKRVPREGGMRKAVAIRCRCKMADAHERSQTSTVEHVQSAHVVHKRQRVRGCWGRSLVMRRKRRGLVLVWILRWRRLGSQHQHVLFLFFALLFDLRHVILELVHRHPRRGQLPVGHQHSHRLAFVLGEWRRRAEDGLAGVDGGRRGAAFTALFCRRTTPILRPGLGQRRHLSLGVATGTVAMVTTHVASSTTAAADQVTDLITDRSRGRRGTVGVAIVPEQQSERKKERKKKRLQKML